jgi:hypothetical protein
VSVDSLALLVTAGLAASDLELVVHQSGLPELLPPRCGWPICIT